MHFFVGASPTRGPGDHRTRGREDQGTRGPGNQEHQKPLIELFVDPILFLSFFNPFLLILFYFFDPYPGIQRLGGDRLVLMSCAATDVGLEWAIVETSV